MRAGRVRALNLAWSAKRLAGCHSTPQLDEQFVLLKFNKDQADALAWLAAKRAAIASDEIASDHAGVQKQLRKHQEHKVGARGQGADVRTRGV